MQIQFDYAPISQYGDAALDDVSVVLDGGASVLYQDDFEPGNGRFDGSQPFDPAQSWVPVLSSMDPTVAASQQWRENSGGTNSAGTGPSTGARGPGYLYFEATGYGGSASNGRLLRNYNLTGTAGRGPRMFFFYNMNGSGIGTMTMSINSFELVDECVAVMSNELCGDPQRLCDDQPMGFTCGACAQGMLLYDDTCWFEPEEVLVVPGADNGDVWLDAEADISQFLTGEVLLRFLYESAPTGENNDVGLDKIQLLFTQQDAPPMAPPTQTDVEEFNGGVPSWYTPREEGFETSSAWVFSRDTQGTPSLTSGPTASYDANTNNWYVFVETSNNSGKTFAIDRRLDMRSLAQVRVLLT